MENWIEAQRLGVLAYALHVLPVGAPKSPQGERFDRGRELLARYVDGAGSDSKQRHLFFVNLPPPVLSVLHNTLQQGKLGRRFNPLVSEIRDARQALHEGEDGSSFGRVQVWAYHAMITSTHARRLLKLGTLLFGRTWKQFERDATTIEALGEPLQQLRDRWASSRERCAAISELSKVIGEPLWWAQICNVLFHHQFAWPLLVVESATEERTVAISLPVAVDVFLDKSREQLSITPRESAFLRVEWYGHLLKSLTAARHLWRAKHGNYGEFRYKVEAASGLFDFETAEAIAAPLREMGLETLGLDGGSAEGYFAQVILNRLLGRSGMLASAATGMIGDPILNDDGTPSLNREFLLPKRVKQKLAYVFESGGLFERVVLPADVHPAAAMSLDVRPTAEVRYAPDLYTMADIVQVKGWRQHRYVRCPELSWGIHSERLGRPGLLPEDHPEVESVIVRLRENESSPILSLDDISGQAVASALWRINSTRRLSLKPNTPPSLSWAFLRAFEWEKDRRFWQVIWDLIGATSVDFEEFARSATSSEAADHIARALNRFAPDKEHPSHRAPDILVLLNYSALIENDPLAADPAARPFLVPEILRILSAPAAARDSSPSLHGPFDWRFAPLIGRTRIVLLTSQRDELDKIAEQPIPIREEDKNILDAIAIFPWGFTQQTAALTLSQTTEARGDELRQQVLRPLVDRGLLREGQGWYHMPRGIRDAAATTDDLTLARRHFSAGCALAPYATGHETPSLALDVAFQPQFIHDAERHLTLAHRYAQNAHHPSLPSEIRKVLDRVTRFAEPPTWGTVSNLLKAQGLPRDAYEMAQELVESADASAIHPQHYLLAARAAAQWAKSCRGERNPIQERVRADANRYFRAALDRCAAFPGEEERTGLQALTAYAVYLATEEPERLEEAEDATSRALELIARGADGRVARGEWYEMIADKEVDHGKAASLYELGVRFVPEWAQLWVKGIGAASLADATTLRKELLTRLDAKRVSDDGRAWNVVAKCQKAYERQRSNGPQHVTLRWQRGREHLGPAGTR